MKKVVVEQHAEQENGLRAMLVGIFDDEVPLAKRIRPYVVNGFKSLNKTACVFFSVCIVLTVVLTLWIDGSIGREVGKLSSSTTTKAQPLSTPSSNPFFPSAVPFIDFSNSMVVNTFASSPADTNILSASLYGKEEPKMFLSVPVSANVQEGNHFKTTYSVIVAYANNPYNFLYNGPTNQVAHPKYHRIGAGTVGGAGGIYEEMFLVDFFTSAPDDETDFYIFLARPKLN
jgi:hypothetical protein